MKGVQLHTMWVNLKCVTGKKSDSKDYTIKNSLMWCSWKGKSIVTVAWVGAQGRNGAEDKGSGGISKATELFIILAVLTAGQNLQDHVHILYVKYANF